MAEKEVIIMEFYLKGCAPCIEMAKILDELAEEYGDAITVRKLDVETTNPAMLAQYNVISTPTIVILADGEIVHKGRGMHAKRLLKRKIEDALTA